MLADLHLRHHAELRERTGSFWHQLCAEPDRRDALLNLGQQHSLVSDFDRGLNRLAGLPDASTVVSQRWLFFDPCQVIAAGDVDLDDPLWSLDMDQRDLTLSAHQIRYWGIPLTNMVPLQIQAGYQSFTLGVDCFVSANRHWLLFRRNPAEFAPAGRLLVRVGRIVDPPSWWSYLLGMDLPDKDRLHVVEYLRHRQTPAQLRLALAAAGGLAITPAAGELMEIQQRADLTIYHFDRFTMKVPYAHPALVVHQRYPRHHIIGDGVEVHQASEAKPGTGWWRAVDWKGGMVLDPIIRWPNLKLEDRLVTAYTTGTAADVLHAHRTHVRFSLSADFHSESAYWADVWRRERASRQFLNEVLELEADDGSAYTAMLAANTQANQINQALGLPAEPPPVDALANNKLVNPLDFFFSTVLGLKSYVVVLRLHHCPRPKLLLQFLRQHLPMTGVPILFSMAPELPIETIGATDSIQITDTVTHGDAGTAALQQAVEDRLELELLRDQVFVTN